MPRLVLYDDDGRQLFEGQVSERNVQLVAGFMRRNMGALRAVAAVKAALDGAGVKLPRLPAAPSARRRRARL